MPKILRDSPDTVALLRLILLLVVLLLGAAHACSERGRVPFLSSQTELPKPVVLSSAPQVSERRCAECHSDITDAFSKVPHARTLTRATREDVLKCFAGRSFHRDSSELDFHYRFEDDRLLVSTPAYARDLTIEWVFGSGTHARTPLITWTDDQGNTSAIEHSVSWYPDQKLGVTLGMEKLKESNGILCLGLPRSSAETINCFGCHCTHVPTDGKRILFEGIQPGIGCSRCHWNTTQHVHEMDLGLSTTIERFSRMTPQESIDRCGECHRRADEMGGEIRPEDETLPRFASVGLVQSACFKRQEEVLPLGNQLD
ncbi:MAG: multiheme c-type cytochrome [Planctomycetaceae bacterium]